MFSRLDLICSIRIMNQEIFHKMRDDADTMK